MKRKLMKQTLTATTLLLCLLLAGGLLVGCDNSTTPSNTPDADQDTDYDPTANWPTYQNDDWGFSLKYPKNWHYREYIEGNKISLSLDSEPIMEQPNSGMMYPISIFSGYSSLEDAETLYQNQKSREEIILGNKNIVVIEYYTELLMGNVFVYLYQEGGKIFGFTSPDPSQYKTILEKIITNFQTHQKAR